MKYCLSVLLHKTYFDLAIVSDSHEIVKKKVCSYKKHMDIASSIYFEYKQSFSEYKVCYVGVGIANNIEFSDGLIYNLQGANRYDITMSLGKIFKKDVYVLEESSLAGLALSYKMNSDSLLYLIFDSRISNSFVIDHNIVCLEEDIDIKKSDNVSKCIRSYFKQECLKRDLDDEFVCSYFFSENEKAKEVVSDWCNIVSREINRITKELKVEDIAFAGYLGSYYDDFKNYIKIGKNVRCHAINSHKENTLVGVSHLMFKDNR